MKDNEIEGTKEALYKTEGMNKLVVTCPTKRIFTLSVPQTIKTCEEARNWLNPFTRLGLKARCTGRT